MPGLQGEAAIIGFVELPTERKPQGPPRFMLEQWADLAALALEDAGISASEVNGIVTHPITETPTFGPTTLAEYLGMGLNFGETVDLGGATAAGMVWRAAAAIELGICDVVLAVAPGTTTSPRSPYFASAAEPWAGASSARFGSPQAEFEIPYGNVGQNAPYAQIARRYAHEFGYDPRALAKIAADQRTNACATPGAIFYGKPLSIDDVLSSPMIADPIHLLEMVMSCHGGAAVVIAGPEATKRAKNRPVHIQGFGEHLSFKTPTYAVDLMRGPLSVAAGKAFAMAGTTPEQVDMASIYDCYTITVLLSLEDAGFCEKGAGAQFVLDHDLTFSGDFPLNTAGGQLSYGQAGLAGGMHHVCDATRQIMGRAGDAQVADCNTAFVSGNGGIMSEQVALILGAAE